VLNGAIVALLDMRKPLVRLEDSEMTVDSSVKQPLSLAHLPLSFTFGLTENNIFVDPSMT
jgi:exosome complex RNA-binding protein Rrp42 (RNase PH superfamily)